MLTKKLKNRISEEANDILRQASEAKEFHTQINDEIQNSKNRMKERRKKFQFIRNK